MRQLLNTLLVTSLLATAGAALAVGAPANSKIENTGTFEYNDDAGGPVSEPSNKVTVNVQQVYGVELGVDGTRAAPGETVPGNPGLSADLTYTLTNTGNGADTYTLTTDDGQGGAVTVTYLVNGAPVTGNQITLKADESVTVVARYGVPKGGAGGDLAYVNPTATSSASSAQDPVFDNNNVHAVRTRDIHDLTLTGDNTLSVTSPGVVTGNHVLKNTGNTPIASGDLNAGAVLSGANILAATGGARYKVFDATNQSGSALDSFADALADYLGKYGPLAPGESLTVQAWYTAASGKAAALTARNDLSVSFGGTTDANNEFVIGPAGAQSAFDTITTVKGEASVVKTAENCHASATCAGTVDGANVKPGDYLRYTVTVTNTGTSALKFPVLKDYVPANTAFVSLAGTTDQAGGAALFSLNKTDLNPTWSATAPGALAASTSATSGPFVYVGLNSDGNAVVNASDSIAVGQTLTLTLIVKVRATGTSN